MPRALKKRVAVAIAFALGLAPMCLSRADKDAPPLKTEFYNGKVVALAEVLNKEGVKLDADAASSWMALVTDEGKIYPLVKDAGARMFFKDAKLLSRPMRLTGRLVPGSSLLEVVNVHSYLGGKLHEVYYWCDICTIKGYEAGICNCCGGPMELREVPVK